MTPNLRLVEGGKDEGPSHASTLRDMAVTAYVKASWRHVQHPTGANEKAARLAMANLQRVIAETRGQR